MSSIFNNKDQSQLHKTCFYKNLANYHCVIISINHHQGSIYHGGEERTHYYCFCVNISMTWNCIQFSETCSITDGISKEERNVVGKSFVLHFSVLPFVSEQII